MQPIEWGLDAGRKEAQESAGGDSGHIPIAQQKDQTLLLTDPESQQYLELLQEFNHYMQRWKDVLFSPEYQIYHEGSKNSSARVGEFDIIQSGGIQEIVPTNEKNKKSGLGIVRVSGNETEFDIIPKKRRDNKKRQQTERELEFRITSLREDGLHLIDPLIKMPLQVIRIYAYKDIDTTKRKKTKQKSGTDIISINCSSAETVAETIGKRHLLSPKYVYGTEYLLNPHKIEIRRENEDLPPTSNDHFQSLLQFVDSFIPRQMPEPVKPQTHVPLRRQVQGR